MGAILTVYSRQFKITNYADEFTRQAFHSQELGGQNLQKSLLLVKPDAYIHLGKIVELVEN